MNIIEKSIWLVNVVLILSPFPGYSQALNDIGIANKSGLTTDNVVLSDNSTINLSGSKPLYSFLLNNKPFNSGEVNALKTGGQYSQVFDNNLKVTYDVSVPSDSGWKGELVFENEGADTVSISNVVPFGKIIVRYI